MEERHRVNRHKANSSVSLCYTIQRIATTPIDVPSRCRRYLARDYRQRSLLRYTGIYTHRSELETFFAHKQKKKNLSSIFILQYIRKMLKLYRAIKMANLITNQPKFLSTSTGRRPKQRLRRASYSTSRNQQQQQSGHCGIGAAHR